MLKLERILTALGAFSISVAMLPILVPVGILKLLACAASVLYSVFAVFFVQFLASDLLARSLSMLSLTKTEKVIYTWFYYTAGLGKEMVACRKNIEEQIARQKGKGC